MAKTLSSISFDAPAAPVTADVNDTFDFSGTPGFTGTGGVNRYDFKWEVDSGSGYVTIASGTGLITAGTNPVTNSNSQAQQSITVTCDEAGSYTIRMAGAPTTGGSYTVLSSEQTVTVSAVPDALTADDIATGSPTLTSPAIGQVHVLTADDIATGTPTLGTPVLSEVVDLLADDIVSGTPALGTPAIGQAHVLMGDDLVSGVPVLDSPEAYSENENEPVYVGAGGTSRRRRKRKRAYYSDLVVPKQPVSIKAIKTRKVEMPVSFLQIDRQIEVSRETLKRLQQTKDDEEQMVTLLLSL